MVYGLRSMLCICIYVKLLLKHSHVPARMLQHMLYPNASHEGGGVLREWERPTYGAHKGIIFDTKEKTLPFSRAYKECAKLGFWGLHITKIPRVCK